MTIGVPALLLGLTSFRQTCGGHERTDSCFNKSAGTEVQSWTGFGFMLGGALFSGFGAMFAVLGLAFPDGEIWDHHLSDAQARTFAAKYKRALLRRSLREVRQVHRQVSHAGRSLPARQPSGLTLVPAVGAGYLGFAGMF